jgi:hypothetical protein
VQSEPLVARHLKGRQRGRIWRIVAQGHQHHAARTGQRHEGLRAQAMPLQQVPRALCVLRAGPKHRQHRLAGLLVQVQLARQIDALAGACIDGQAVAIGQRQHLAVGGEVGGIQMVCRQCEGHGVHGGKVGAWRAHWKDCVNRMGWNQPCAKP